MKKFNDKEVVEVTLIYIVLKLIRALIFKR